MFYIFRYYRTVLLSDVKKCSPIQYQHFHLSSNSQFLLMVPPRLGSGKGIRKGAKTYLCNLCCLPSESPQGSLTLRVSPLKPDPFTMTPAWLPFCRGCWAHPCSPKLCQCGPFLERPSLFHKDIAVSSSNLQMRFRAVSVPVRVQGTHTLYSR